MNTILLLLSLLCVFLANVEGTPVQFKIASLLPLKHKDAAVVSFATEIKSAFLIACDHFNKNKTATQVELVCDSIEFDGTASDASAAARNKIVPGQYMAVVGPLRSTNSIAVQKELIPAKIVQISPASSSDLLSNYTQYPYFFRTVSPDRMEAAAIFDLLRRYEWSDVAIIQGDSDADDSDMIMDALRTEFGHSNMNVVFNGTFKVGENSTTKIPAMLDELNMAMITHPVKVVVLSANPTDAVSILTAAWNANMYSTAFGGRSKWIWVVTDAVTLTGGKMWNQFTLARDAAQGALGIAQRGGTGKLFYEILCNWLEKPDKDYPGILYDVDEEALRAHTYVPETIDAVYAIGEAAKYVILSNANRTDGAVFLNAIYESDFNGTSGYVNFDADTNDPKEPHYDLVNLVGNDWKRVGEWKYGKSYHHVKSIVFPGGSTEPVYGRAANHLTVVGVFPTAETLPLMFQDWGNELKAAFTLACEWAGRTANLRGTGFDLRCVTKASLGDKDGAALANEILTEENLIGVVGAITSNVSLQMNAVLAPRHIPMVSPAATSSVLKDKTYFYRMTPLDSTEGYALANLVQHFNWSEVAMIYDGDDAQMVETMKVAAEQAVAKSIQVTFSKAVKGNFTVNDLLAPLAELRDESTTRVVLLGFAGWELETVFEALVKFQMIGKGWTYLGTTNTVGVVNSDEWLADDKNAEIHHAMQGLVSLRVRGGHGAFWDFVKGGWTFRDAKTFPGRIHEGREPVQFAAETFDAVFAFANTISDMIKKGYRSATQLTSGQSLNEYLPLVKFNGTTGVVSFSKDDHGPPEPKYDIVNLRGSNYFHVGTWSVNPETYDTKDSHITIHETVMWPDARLDTPLANAEAREELFNKEDEKIGKGRGGGVGTVVALVIFVILLLISLALLGYVGYKYVLPQRRVVTA